MADRVKDLDDLEGTTLDNKFKYTVDYLNFLVFNNEAQVTYLSKREFNLYKTGYNQIIQFTYSTGILTITWRYKYFQKEVIHKKNFYDVRNLSMFAQERIAETMALEMKQVIEKHHIDVLSEM